MKTTTDLLSDAKRLAMIPVAQALGTQDADLLAIADMEMATRVLPVVLSVNEEFNVQTVDIPVVAGQQQYRMPTRAVGAKLRDVRYVQGGVVFPLPRLEIEQLGAWTLNASGIPQGFWLEAGSINLQPAPPPGGALRVRYYARQAKLVAFPSPSTANIALVASVGPYTTVNRLNDTVEVTPDTAAFNPAAPAKVDIISSNTPYEYLAIDATLSSVSGGARRLTVSTALGVPGRAPNLSPNVAAGDVLVNNGSAAPISPVVQLPDEAYPLLVTRLACALMAQLGDLERLQSLEASYERAKVDYLRLTAPRVDGAPKKVQGFLTRGALSRLKGW